MSTYVEMREMEGKERGKIQNGVRMDERVMEEKGKDRKGEGWGIRIKKVILFGIFLNWQIKNFVVLN